MIYVKELDFIDGIPETVFLIPQYAGRELLASIYNVVHSR
jgi:hypothetical protein